MKNKGKISLSISILVIVILTIVFCSRIPVFGNTINANYMKQFVFVSAETGDNNTITYKSEDKEAIISYQKDDRNEFVVNINGKNSYKIDSDYVIHQLNADTFTELNKSELVNNNLQEYLLLNSIRDNYNIKSEILINIIVSYVIAIIFIFNHKVAMFIKNIPLLKENGMDNFHIYISKGMGFVIILTSIVNMFKY